MPRGRDMRGRASRRVTACRRRRAVARGEHRLVRDRPRLATLEHVQDRLEGRLVELVAGFDGRVGRRVQRRGHLASVSWAGRFL